MNQISLSDWIEAIRTDLQNGVRRAAKRDPDDNLLSLQLQEVTLEATIATERSAEGSTGIKFWVVVGAKASERTAETQRIKVTLKSHVDVLLGGGEDLFDAKQAKNDDANNR